MVVSKIYKNNCPRCRITRGVCYEKLREGDNEKEFPRQYIARRPQCGAQGGKRRGAQCPCGGDRGGVGRPDGGEQGRAGVLVVENEETTCILAVGNGKAY
uniref:Uncharacterized protein n=1 Tax=Triticum urartu TaxID=4572 RepID=A0A8R7PC53_TRIUA